jgi:hypothetical protein
MWWQGGGLMLGFGVGMFFALLSERVATTRDKDYLCKILIPFAVDGDYTPWVAGFTPL